MQEIVMTDIELLNRLDQMAIEIERLRQYILESMAAKRQRKKFKSVREYEACGMWADREEWQGLSTEECLAQIREKAWGDPRRWRGEPFEHPPLLDDKGTAIGEAVLRKAPGEVIYGAHQAQAGSRR